MSVPVYRLLLLIIASACIGALLAVAGWLLACRADLRRGWAGGP